MVPSWLSRSKQAHGRINRRKRGARRMVLESLESRAMMSTFQGVVFDDADGDGIVNWQGNADRYGRLLPAPCDTLGVDCAPVIFRGLRAGQLYGAADSHTASSFRDYDIYFDQRSAGWNQPVP